MVYGGPIDKICSACLPSSAVWRHFTQKLLQGVNCQCWQGIIQNFTYTLFSHVGVDEWQRQKIIHEYFKSQNTTLGIEKNAHF